MIATKPLKANRPHGHSVIKKWCLVFFLLGPFISNAQIITTYAGNGIIGYSGDNGVATNALLAYPSGINFDNNGNLLICQHELIRKINKVTKVINTIAGDTATSNINNDSLAINALVNMPYDVCLDGGGNLYITDYWAIEVRKVDILTGIITDYAGTTSMGGFSGDGGPADSAKLGSPFAVCVDTIRKALYVSDEFNYRVRKVDMVSGIITTIAGKGVNGYSGDSGLADSAELSRVLGLALDHSGNLYIGDWDNARIRKVDISTGIITTYAGNGITGYSGDSALAINAMISRASFLVFDKCDNLFFSDELNERVRRIDKATGIITTVAGNGTAGFLGDSGLAVNAELYHPEGLAIDDSSNLFISDYNNQRVRKVTFDTTIVCSGTTGIQDIVSAKNVKIYPNPATTELTVTAPTKITGVLITNLLGQTVYTHQYNNEQVEINIVALPTGMYVVKVTDEKGVQTVSKIVKE